jgi:aminoglycoside phosphotransferase (APT) family kinase protein
MRRRPEAGVEPELLTLDNLADYLESRGLAPAGVVWCRSLGGGVSNVVLAAGVGDRALVVKQSLPRLRVADEWLAKRERVFTEARALGLQARLTPGRVPSVLDVDPDRFTITIAHAPEGWSDWKARLLAGDADPDVAAELGRVLGVWHRATRDDPDVAGDFADWEAFEQLRVDPYYRTLARRCPDLAAPVLSRIARMEASRHCLVHGDFSPKNVLLGSDGGERLWVVDAEVAHYGDPAFDTGFMLNHLLLKAINRLPARASYRACALAFWQAYERQAGGAGAADTLGHLACLMLSRVHGKSPAEYLDTHGRALADRVGRRLLLGPPKTVEGAWDALEETAV